VFQDSVLDVPAACGLPGRNHLRFRPLGEGGLEVAGASPDPAQ